MQVKLWDIWIYFGDYRLLGRDYRGYCTEGELLLLFLVIPGEAVGMVQVVRPGFGFIYLGEFILFYASVFEEVGMMPDISRDDIFENELSRNAHGHFQRMVDTVGIKRFASAMGLSTRQVNRILAGTQPNPIARVIQCVQSCEAAVGDRAVDFICQEAGGYFVREEIIDHAAVNAVKECAEAIAAISDGEISECDEIEIREAVQALMTLARSVREHREKQIRAKHPRQ